MPDHRNRLKKDETYLNRTAEPTRVYESSCCKNPRNTSSSHT